MFHSIYLCIHFVTKILDIFTIIALNSFSGRLPIFHLFGLVGFYHFRLSASRFSFFSFCLIYCFWGRLFVGLKVVVPLICQGSPPCLGLDQWLVKFPSVGDLCPCSCCWWNCVLSPWRVVPYPVVCFGVSLGLLWLWAACLIMGKCVFLFCWRFCLRCLVVKIACFWVRLGLSVERPLEELLLINVPWLGGLLVLGPVLRSPISVVKAQPLNAAPKCHRPHSTEHKTPRLMVKPQPRTSRETHTLILRKEQEKKRWKKKKNRSWKRRE